MLSIVRKFYWKLYFWTLFGTLWSGENPGRNDQTLWYRVLPSPVIPLVSLYNAASAISFNSKCRGVRSKMTFRAVVGHVLIGLVVHTHANRCSL